MVLREILKTDTSSSEHTKLNNYHENLNKSSDAKNVEKVEFNQPTSLLSDPQKFADFKNAIFAKSPSEKRKNEGDDNGDDDKNDDEVDSKRMKMDDANEEESLKIQADLV